MNSFTLICSVGILVSSVFIISHATVGGQYSVNVHFVPPLVNAPCPVAQFWTPENVTCAMCFCMTGTLSRCVPRPGCNPNAPNNDTGTTTTTAAPKPDAMEGMGAEMEAATEAMTMTDEDSSSAPGSPGSEVDTKKNGRLGHRRNSIKSY